MIVHELNPAHFDIARPVLATAWYDHSTIDSVLAGQRVGRVFVDHPQTPTSALLCHHDSNFYVAGDVAESLRQFLNDEPREANLFDRPHLCYYPVSEAWEQVLLHDAHNRARVVPRRTFILEDAGTMPFPDWRERLPPGITMRRIDRELAERVDRDLDEQYIGPVWNEAGFDGVRYPAAGYDTFACKSFGYCALARERVICASWAFAVSDRYASLEIETAADYRWRGLATLTCAAVLEYCHEHSLASEWICDVDNEGSARLALKLGHRELRPCQQINWHDFGQPYTLSGEIWSGESGSYGTAWIRVPLH